MTVQNADQFYFNDFLSCKYEKIMTKWQFKPELL